MRALFDFYFTYILKLFFKLFIKIVPLGLFYMSTINCYGQYFENNDNNFQKLTIENGLSQNTINCILRDRTGFIWFGTENGLNKFDGKKITILDKDFGSSKNFKDYKISDILQDKAGIIWIASENGIIKYDPDFEKIDQYLLSTETDRKTSVLCIEEDNDYFLWLGTTDGLMRFEKKTGHIVESFNNEPYQPYSISNNEVYALCKKNDNELWIGTANGLNIFQMDKKIFIQYFHDINDPKSIGEGKIRKIIKDSNKRIWIGTEGGGLSCYNSIHKNFDTFNTHNSKIPYNDIRDIFERENGMLWIAANGGGLSLFNTNKLIFKNFTYDPRNVNGLSNNSIYSVYEDYEGILWIGLYSGGINFNASKISNFKSIVHLPANTNSICENNARSLFIDSKNNLWIGTLNGLSKYDPHNNHFTSFIPDENNGSSLSFNTITTVFEDIDKNIWVGTYSGGINLLKRNTKGFVHFKHQPSISNSLSNNNIYCILQDSNNKIWAATSKGLNLFNPKENNWIKIGNLDVRDICTTFNQKMYLAILGGICEFDPISQKYKSFLYNDNSSTPTTVLLNDNSQDLWFGTQGEGFGYFNKDSKRFKMFTTKNGLPSNFISAIVKYSEHYLWLSTYKGISLFNKENQTFKNYGMIDGIPFLEFYPKSSVILPDKTIAFGGTNGIVYFDPEKILSEKGHSKILFSSLKIGGKKVEIGGKNSPLQKNLNQTELLKLKYGQRDFSIEFVDINFKNKGFGQYLFKIDNYIKDWRSIESQNIIEFMNMPPGKYVLRVKSASGNNNQTNQYEKKLNIQIVPPLWMRWYFFALLILALFGILYLYSKYTLISINQRNKIKLKNIEYKKREEYNRLRLKFLTYISHELRTPLTLILDPVHKLIKNNKDKEKVKYLELIRKNSGRLIRLVDQILDFRKLENDTLNLLVTKKNLVKIVSDIFTDFEEVANTEQIKYTFENKIDDHLTGWVDSDKIEKILYNLLNNAFKFTKAHGEVIVRLSAPGNNEKVKIVVCDTGYGMTPDKLQHIFELFFSDEKMASHYQIGIGVGVGLTYVKRLVDLHHGTITVKSEIDKGTSFTVILPLRKKDYASNEIWLLNNENKITNYDENSAINWSEQSNSIPVHGTDVPQILIVEDETDLRSYLANQIGQKFRVIQAVDGLDALNKLEHCKPDLILSDNVMPGMDGISFCNEVKNRKDLSSIPFVFLSAWNSDDYKLRGLTVGAEDYISKPFQFNILEAKIESIIKNRQRLSQIAQKMIKVVPNNTKIETSDEIFIHRTQEIIEKEIENSDFTTKDFESKLFMSHSAIYRKLKLLTGLSANEYIREYRLRRAAQILLQDKNITINEICFKVGFTDSKYFSQCFKKLFNINPSEYAQNQQVKD